MATESGKKSTAAGISSPWVIVCSSTYTGNGTRLAGILCAGFCRRKSRNGASCGRSAERENIKVRRSGCCSTKLFRHESCGSKTKNYPILRKVSWASSPLILLTDNSYLTNGDL